MGDKSEGRSFFGKSVWLGIVGLCAALLLSMILAAAFGAQAFAQTGSPTPTAVKSPTSWPPRLHLPPRPIGTPGVTSRVIPKRITTSNATCPSVVTFPVGPTPSARGPVAVAVDSANGRAYVVQRQQYADVAVDPNGLLPTNVVSVVDEATGGIIATIPVGNALNGEGQGIAVDPGRYRVFVTNADDGTVSIIDTTSDQVVQTVSVGSGPEGIAVDPNLGRVYVANSGSNSVSVLDENSGAVINTVSLTVNSTAASPAAVAVDPSTDQVYLTANAGGWNVVDLDGSSLTVRGSVNLPLLLSLHGIAVDPGSQIYVAAYTSNTVAIINSASLQWTSSIYELGAPDGLAVDPTSHLLYIAESGTNTVDVYSSAGVKQQTVNVQQRPVAIAVDTTTHQTYVANVESDSLSAIATSAETLAGTIPLGTADFGIAYDPTAQRLYAANYVADSVIVANAATHATIANWASGSGPWSVAVDPSLGQVDVLDTNDGTLNVFDTTAGTVKATLAIGSGGNAVAVSPTTHRVYVTSGQGLTVIDGTTNQIVTTVPLGTNPVGIAIDDPDQRVFVANQQSGTISVVSSATNQVIATWTPPETNVWGLAFDPNLEQLYVTVPAPTIGSFHGVEALDARTGALVWQQQISRDEVNLVAVDPSSHQVYVTANDDNSSGLASNGLVYVFDGNSGDSLATAYVGLGPNALVVDPTTGTVYVGNAQEGTVSEITPCPATSVGTLVPRVYVPAVFR